MVNLLQDFDSDILDKFNVGNTWGMKMIVRYSQIWGFYEKYLLGSKDRVLDVGCSTAKLLRFYQLHFANYNRRLPIYTGVELNKKYLNKARNWVDSHNEKGQLYRRTKLLHGDVMSKKLYDDFGPRSFDLIIANEIIEHVKKEKEIDFLDCLDYVLDDNGYLIISTPVHYDLDEKVYHPDVHNREYQYNEFVDIVNRNFKIIYEIGTYIKTKDFKRKLREHRELYEFYKEAKRKFIPIKMMVSLFDYVLCDKPENLMLICEKKNSERN